MTDKIPDGIIRAYRKALKTREAVTMNQLWLEDVIWELTQLYPELNKLPKEE
jgi:hypothetical protein